MAKNLLKQTKKFVQQTKKFVQQTKKFVQQTEKFVQQTEKFVQQTEKFVQQIRMQFSHQIMTVHQGHIASARFLTKRKKTLTCQQCPWGLWHTPRFSFEPARWKMVCSKKQDSSTLILLQGRAEQYEPVSMDGSVRFLIPL